ncbi:MAG: hypothetical protein JO048_15305 [Methylobacteriaceae bacterium]|nr:hypothetical protein [Methylobacteriaceae bacterium]
MASGQQGTGKHSHKSAAEPYPHTKDGQEGGSARGRSRSDQKEERQQEAGGGSGRQQGSSERGARQQGDNAQQGGGGSDDLKSREYRDEQGNVHHHTRAYMEQHKGE